MTPLGREALDQFQCASPHHDDERHEHGPLFLHSRCHPDSPAWAVYHEGVLTVQCAECRNDIILISVAP